MPFETDYMRTFDKLKDELKDLVKSTPSINVRNDGTRTKYNYNGRCIFEKECELACRGTIFHDGFLVTAPRKFFTSNIEGLGQLYNMTGKTLQKTLKDAEEEGWQSFLMNKYDGSFIMIYADKDGFLHASTRGSLNNENPMNPVFDKEPKLEMEKKNILRGIS